MSNSSYNPSDFSDDRDEQSTLAVGADSLTTQDRESRIDTGDEFTDKRDDKNRTPTVAAQADITGTVQWPGRAKQWLSTTDTSGEGIYLRLSKTSDDAKRPFRLVFEDKDAGESYPVGEALTRSAGRSVLSCIEDEMLPTDFPSIHDSDAQAEVREIIRKANSKHSDTDGFAAFSTTKSDCKCATGNDAGGSAEGYDPTAFDFDDYGPTSDHPIPEAEGSTLPDVVDDRALVGSGLSASDWDESTEHIGEDGTTWHHHDTEDPVAEEAFEEMAGAGSNPTGESPKDGAELTFERLDAANDWRDDHPDALVPSDTRRTKTVTLRDDVDDQTLESGENAAFVSQNTGKSYGQLTLTDAERARLDDKPDWTWGTKGFHAMSAKAVLVEEGADNWLDHYQSDLEPIEHASVVESGKEMAAVTGLTGPGETGEIDDSDPDMQEMARQTDKGLGEGCQQARDYCEGGDDGACQHLEAECGYTEDEIDSLRDAFALLDEPLDFVLDASAYDPTNTDMVDSIEADVPSQSFEGWAAQMEPEADRPTDDELARPAPTSTDDPVEMHQQLPGPALRALRKAWGGYRAARAEERSAVGNTEQYAEIINGVRAVNGQKPLSFEKLDGWAGGEPLPDDPTETFPGPDGRETIEEASAKGRISRAVQASFGAFGTVYDPSDGRVD
ncbi:hypothetical protein [Haladaptatus cibarius]|uniref:hypothetical protein n=1 Tax=Haladaptatus cibarius TaxID=453847 RepID=UPI00067950E2|nr:hypothetical protein [Haladaptatus cibarius]